MWEEAQDRGDIITQRWEAPSGPLVSSLMEGLYHGRCCRTRVHECGCIFVPFSMFPQKKFYTDGTMVHVAGVDLNVSGAENCKVLWNMNCIITYCNTLWLYVVWCHVFPPWSCIGHLAPAFYEMDQGVVASNVVLTAASLVKVLGARQFSLQETAGVDVLAWAASLVCACPSQTRLQRASALLECVWHHYNPAW